MPLETASYVQALVTTNPVHTDGLNQADAHLRLLKTVLTNTFPNLSAAVNATPTQLNQLASTDTLCTTGMVSGFLLGTSNPSWLRLNGGTFNYADYPALGAYLGYSSGVCTLPNWEDTGRFPRSVLSGVAANTKYSSQNKTHTHGVNVAMTVSGNTGIESASHYHNVSGNTGGQNVDHTHTSSVQAIGTTAQGGTGASGLITSGGSNFSTGGTSNDHLHAININSGTESANHTHAVSIPISGSFTTGNGSADGAEARPESVTLIYYVHI